MKKLGSAVLAVSLFAGCGGEFQAPTLDAVSLEGKSVAPALAPLPKNLTFDGEWYRWAPSKVALQNSTVTTVKGAFVPGEGCVFDSSMETPFLPPPEGMVYRTQQIAFRDSPCERQYETGLIPASESKGAMTKMDSRYATETASMPILSPLATTLSQTAAGVSGSRSWWIYAAYEDPVALDVNGVHLYMKFSYNGSTSSITQWQVVWSWLSATGWSKVSGSAATTSGSSVSNVRAYASYYNDKFCSAVLGILGSPTSTAYWPTYFYGRYDGSMAYTLNRSKSGGCTSAIRDVFDQGAW